MTTAANHFDGRVALVTGAAKRLGRATAEALAGRGADLVIHYRTSADEAEALADSLRQKGRRVWALSADLANPADAEALMARAIDLAGGVDILVNNASIFPRDHLLDLDPAALETNLAVHAVSPLLLSRAFARQGRGGQIVNFLDCTVHEYDSPHASYHLSKRMLFSITRMLALELAPEITVNAVAPGLILPPPGEDESYLQAMVHTNPLHTHGCAEDITDAVLFLLTSRFLTGQVLYIDGGRHMKGRVYG